MEHSILEFDSTGGGILFYHHFPRGGKHLSKFTFK